MFLIWDGVDYCSNCVTKCVFIKFANSFLARFCQGLFFLARFLYIIEGSFKEQLGDPDPKPIRFSQWNTRLKLM